jgi:hypothetical protein
MQLEDDAAIKFLQGSNSVRDGYLVALSVETPESSTVLVLKFHVPRSSCGSDYTLRLTCDLSFDYGFCSEHSLSQIEMVKCLETDDGYFYLSLDPWKKDENFISSQDNDWFKSRSVLLVVTT